MKCNGCGEKRSLIKCACAIHRCRGCMKPSKKQPGKLVCEHCVEDGR